jgi:hypothetical protein
MTGGYGVPKENRTSGEGWVTAARGGLRPWLFGLATSLDDRAGAQHHHKREYGNGHRRRLDEPDASGRPGTAEENRFQG